MKAAPLLLTGSLVANAALFAALSLREPAAPAATTPTPKAAAQTATPAATATGGITNPTTPSTDANGAPLTAAEAAAQKQWQAFHGGDLKVMAEKLRAAGFSEDLTRTIVYAEIQQRLAGKRREITGNVEDVPFWKMDPNGGLQTPAQTKALRELSTESTRLAKEALGESYNTPSAAALENMRTRYGNLPGETITKIQKLQSDYSEMRSEILRALNESGGTLLAEDRQKMDLLDKEMRNDIAKLLTPEQLMDYEIRSDSTSNQMRSRLGAFKPTEEEFRAIYQLQKSMDVEFGSSGARTSEEAQARSARQKELDAQVMAMLGPERGAQYKLSTDSAYTQINRILTRFNLPQQVAVDVVALQQATQQRATALRQDRTLTVPQRNEQLAALQQETQAKVSATLGSRGYEAYQEYGGQWVNNIAPRPAPTPTPNALPR